MLSKLASILDVETVFALLAASGGIARIVTGTSNDPKVSVLGEVGRILFVAMPIGIISGLWVQSISSSEVLPYATSFSTGVISLNIVRFMLSPEGLQMIRNLIGRGPNV